MPGGGAVYGFSIISPEDIAYESEEELPVIQKICNAAEQSKTAEGYDINDIFEKINS